MRIVGQEQIAEVFEVTPKTIVEWQEQGMPVAKRGGPGVPSEYEAAECIQWLVDREVAKAESASPNDRLAKARAEEIEMRNAERRTQLIAADEVEPRMNAALAFAREAWRHESLRIVRQLEGEPASNLEGVLEEAFAAFLLRLSRWPDTSSN